MKTKFVELNVIDIQYDKQTSVTTHPTTINLEKIIHFYPDTMGKYIGISGTPTMIVFDYRQTLLVSESYEYIKERITEI